MERKQREAVEQVDMLRPVLGPPLQIETSRQDESKGRGAGERTRVNYDNGLTDSVEQWLNDFDDDEEEERARVTYGDGLTEGQGPHAVDNNKDAPIYRY